MSFHLGQRVLLLHVSRDTPGIVERVTDGGSDGEICKGRYFSKFAQKLITVLLTSDACCQIYLRVERARLRQSKFLYLSERSDGCRQAAVVLHCLFDELIDGVGVEQSPPIALDLPSEGNVLHIVACGGVFGAQGVARISRCRRRSRSREVGTHGTPAQT